jgi:two-component system LytT family response regulator
LINILICDDDETFLNQVDKLINIWSTTHNINFCVDKRSSGDFIFNCPICYDIAFVDVEMPGISGLKLADELQKKNPDVIIIVLTSFHNYLDEAMKVHVFRYLSKPIDINRFNNNFKDAILEFTNINKSIIIDLKDEVHYIKTKDILYIENLKYGSNIVTKKSKFTTNKKPKEWLSIINQPNCFVYSHNSFIVNLQNVIDFDKTTVTMRKNKSELVKTYMSQRKFKNFKKAFFDFAGGLK